MRIFVWLCNSRCDQNQIKSQPHTKTRKHSCSSKTHNWNANLSNRFFIPQFTPPNSSLEHSNCERAHSSTFRLHSFARIYFYLLIFIRCKFIIVEFLISFFFPVHLIHICVIFIEIFEIFCVNKVLKNISMWSHLWCGRKKNLNRKKGQNTIGQKSFIESSDYAHPYMYGGC